MKKTTDQQQDARLTAIRAAIEPVLSAHAVTLCDLAWTTEASGLTLRITIERPGPDGEVWTPEKGFGVNLDDCANVSRDVSATLDDGEVVDHAYMLEVSSPGLARPLRGAADFRRFRGATVKVKLSSPAPDGQRLLRGELAAAPDGSVVVIVDGKPIEVPEQNVVEAQLVFELPKAPKVPAAKKTAVKKALPEKALPKRAEEGTARRAAR